MIHPRMGASALALTLAVAGFSVANAQAQPQAQPEPTSAVDEIIVTATRTETVASKTPVSLTAVGGAQLVAAGVTNPTGLADRIPNLSIDRGDGLRITIRGVSSADSTEKGDPSAAFMLDGVYIARPQAQEVSFYDLDRVEVLRGPQGTLFGRNTTAGAVNVIAKRPQLGEFSGSASVAYGDYDTRQATATVNLPVSERVALRASVNYDRRDSYLEAGPRFNTQLSPFKDNLSGRLSALFDLGKGSLLLRGDYSSMNGRPFNSVLTSAVFSNYNTTGVDPTYIGDDRGFDEKRTVNVPYAGNVGSANNTWGLMADARYDLGLVEVNYLGAYRRFVRDEDSALLLGSGATAIRTYFDGTYDQNSQELRLVYDHGGKLKAQGGLYYFREESSIIYNLYGLLSQTPGTTGYVYGFPQDPTISKSWAGFGQATYAFTDNLRLTGGIRFSHDDKSRIGFTTRCGTEACNQSTDVKTPNIADRSFEKTTWRLGLDYDLDEATLLYGVVATGYKAGGFNDGCEIGTASGCTLPAGALYYEPETLTSYELGVKTRLFDNALRLSMAAFHYDYDNLQLSQTSSICGGPCRVTTNAAAAKVDGIEAEGALAPWSGGKFDFSVAWLKARYDTFMPTTTIDWSGKRLDRSPEWTASGSYTHTWTLASGAKVAANLASRFSQSYRLASLTTVNQFRIPAYTKTDLSLTYTAPAGAWSVQGFARNLENELVVTSVSTGTFGVAQFADPRTLGVRFGVEF